MSRQTTIETSHGDRRAGSAVARAVRPDNTADVVTTAEGATVRTRIERSTTGGLRSTADDYVVNVRVADRIVRLARGESVAGGDAPAAAGDPVATDDTTATTDETGEVSSDTDTDDTDDT